MAGFQRTIGQAQQTATGSKQAARRIGARQKHAQKTNYGLTPPQVKLGENSKVVETDPHFNLDTGKMESTYITEQGNEYGSRAGADIEQNAVDIAKHMQTLPGQLQDAYAERERLQAEIDAETKRIGYGQSPERSFAPQVPGSIPRQSAERLSNDRLQTLYAAQRQNEERITALEAERDDDGSTQFWRGFVDAAKNPSTWTFGITDLQNMTQLMRIKDKVDGGEQLTDDEETLLKNTMANGYAQQMFGENRGFMYRAGGISMQALPFVAEFVATGGFSSLTQMGASAGEKVAEKFALEGLKKTILRNTGVVMGDIASSFIMANTTGAARTGADIMQRHTGQVTMDEEGNYKFEGGKGIGQSIYEGEVASTLEYYTEKLGEHLQLGNWIAKGADKMGLSKLSKAIGYLSNSKMLNAGGIQDYPSEVVEEQANLLLNAILVGDNNFSIDPNSKDFDKSVFNPKTQLDIWGGMLFSIGLMQAPRLAHTGYSAAGYYAYKHGLDVADTKASAVFGSDNWQMIKEEIDNSDNDNISELLASVVNGDMSSEQKEATIFYADNLLKMRGYNNGMMADVRGEAATESQHTEQDAESFLSHGIDQGYQQGHEAQEADEKKMIVDEANEAEAQLSQMFGEDDVQWITNTEPMEAINVMLSDRSSWSDDEISAVVDYYQKQAMAQGVMDAAADDVEYQVAKANAEVDANTHKGLNQVIMAESGGEQFYIVGGDVRLIPDGEASGTMAFDMEGTGDALIVRNAETGEISVKSPQILSVSLVSDPNQLKMMNETQLRQEVTQQHDDEITFGSPAQEVFQLEDTVTLNDGQGNVIEGEIGQMPNAIDGVYVVYTADGKAMQFTGDELNRMIVAHNGAEVERAAAIQQHTEQAAAQPLPTEQPVEDIGNDYAGGERTLENANEADGSNPPAPNVEPEKPQTAASRIPVNAKGEPDYLQAQPQDSYDALVEDIGEEDANTIIESEVSDAQKRLSRLQKKAPQGATIEEKKRSLAERRAAMEAEQKTIDYWNSVLEIPKARKAEAERIAAERERERIEAERRQKMQTPEGRAELLSEARNTQERAAIAKEIYGDYFNENVLEPDTVEELVSLLLPYGKLNWEGYERGINHVRGLQEEIGSQHTRGLSKDKGTAGFNSYLAKKGEGESLDDIVHDMYIDNANLVGEEHRFTTEEIKDAAIGMLLSAEKPTDVRNYTVNSRIDRAEKALRGELEREAEAPEEAVADEPMMTEQEMPFEASAEKAPFHKVSADDNSFADTDNMTMTKPVGKTSTPDEIQAEEAKVDTNPTEGQKEAGNYQKGHIKVTGLDISIENPKGSVRRGTDANGKEWESTMHNTYGYIRGTKGADKDHIDVFLSDDPTHSDKVFIVQQRKKVNGAWKFDELKVLLGFDDAAQASNAYLSNYEEGWDGMQAIIETDIDSFKEWLKNGNQKGTYKEDGAWAKVYPGVSDMVADEGEMSEPEQQEVEVLRGKGDNRMPGMGRELSEVPGGHGKTATPQSDAGQNRREQGLLQGELQVDGLDNTIPEPKDGPLPDLQGQNDVNATVGSGNGTSAGENKIQNTDVPLERGENAGNSGRDQGQLQNDNLSGQNDENGRLGEGTQPELQNAEEQGETGLDNGKDSRDTSEHKADGNVKATGRRESVLMGAVVDKMREAGIDVSTDWEEGQRVLDEYNGSQELKSMGQKTNKKKAQVAADLEGKELTPEQQAVVDVYTGKKNNAIIEFTRDGKKNRIAMRKGNERFAGTEHSLYGHYGTSEGVISSEDILRIPEILSNGDKTPVKVKNKQRYEYTLKSDYGTEFTVVTERNNHGREEFTDFYSNKKGEISRSSTPSEEARASDTDNALRKASSPLASNTPEGAHSFGDDVSSGAKVQQNPETTKESDEKLKQFKTSDGHAYGFTYKGKIYIDPRIATSETPIHEYGHLWAEMKRQTAPEEWDAIKNVLLNDKLVKPIIDRVKKDYPELTKEGREDDFIEEILTLFSGKRGAERLREIAEQIAAEKGGVFGKAEAVTAMQRLRNVLANFWAGVAKMMGWKYSNAEDVADAVLRDMLNGVNPRERMKEASSQVKSQQEIERTLMGVHNISEDKLRKVLKQGGLANPSLAVIDTKNHMHTDYGEISLIPRASLIDSKTGRNAGTWTADAWTPTYPQVQKRMSDKGQDKYWAETRKSLDDEPGDIRSKTMMAFQSWMENGISPERLSYWYLKERGKNPEQVMYEPSMPKEDIEAYHQAMGDHKRFSELDEAGKSAVLALIAKDRGETPEEMAAKMQELKERNTQRMNDENVKPFMKMRAEMVIGEIDEYGVPYSYISGYDYKVRNAEKTDGKLNVDSTLRKAAEQLKSEGLEEDFSKWLDEKEKSYGVEEWLYDGTDNEGRQKWVRNTLENASRLMRQQGRNGAHGMATGNLIATVAKRVTTLDQIRKEKGNLNTTLEEHEAFKEKWSDALLELSQKCYDGDLWVGEARLQEALGKKNPTAYLKKEYGVELAKEDQELLNTFIKEVRENFPTGYFETKFERPVMLDEFEIAVVPENTSADIVDALKNAGLDVRTYGDTGTEEQRNANRTQATMDAVKGRDDILFQKESKDIGEKERPHYQKGESPIDYAERLEEYDRQKKMGSPEEVPVNMARQIYEDAIRDTGGRMMIPALLASIGNKENWTRFKHKFAESWFDYSRSIKALQDAIEKATGKAIEGFEDVWRALNSKSSVDNVELQRVMHDLVEPLSEYVGEMIKGKEMDGVPLDMDDVEVYLNAVHGIERNERMAMKQAQDEYEEDIALQKQQLESGELADKERKSVEAALLIKEARFYGIKNYMDNETVAKWYNQWKRGLENARTNGTITEEEYQKAKAKMETEYEQGQQYKYRDKDYSGLTALFGEDIDGEDKPTEEQLEQAARDYAAKFEDIVGKESADGLWQHVKALNEWSLRKSYESGLISKEQYQDTLSMYQHYVPLRGWHDDYAGDVYQYISRGEPAEVLQGVLKKAYGRKSRAARIFGTMAAMANTAIVQGNKNLVAQRLLNMAMNHRDSGLLMISEQWYQKTADGELVPQMPNLRDDMTADEMRQELERFEEDMKARENAGEVQTLRKKFKKEFPLHMAKWQEQRHAVRILRNGKENMVYILGDPRAAEAFNGLLNPNSQPGVVSNIISRYMRFLAKMQTSLSPEFLVSNFQRDVLTASTGAYVKFGKDYQKDFIRNLASVMPLTALVGIKKGKGRENLGGIFSLFRKYDEGTLDDRNETERLFKEFVDFGGMTGISYITKSEEYQASMEEIIKRMRQGKMGKVRNGLDAVSDAVEFANKGIENATRFATYMTSRKRGRSVRDSIFDAKEGSVNFNMKGSGSWGNMLARRMYLYVNPAMQSLRMLGTWYENDPAIATKEGGKMVAKTVGRRFMKAAAATLAASVGTAMLNIMLSQLLHGDGDDDDKKGDGDWWALSEWNRYNFVNVINPFGKGYFHWSIPQELRPLWALGQISIDMACGRVTWQRGMQSMLLQLNNLSPLSFFEGGTDTDESIISSELRTLTPSYVSTFTDAYGWNRDFMGHKITNQGDWNKNKPEWQRAGKNTPQFMITASRKWNELTGGRRNKKSWADSPYLNPSALYYVFTQQFGGIGSMSKRMFSAFDQWRDPEQEVEMRNMPFVPKFYVATGDDYSKDRVMNDKFWMYYNEFKDADKEMASDRSSVSAGDMTQAEADKTIEQRKADGTYNTWKVIDDNSLDYVFDKVRGTSLEKDVKRMIVDAVEKGTVPDYSKFVKKDGDKAENEVWEKAISRQREHAVANMTDEEVVKAFDATDDQELRKEMAKRISKDAGASKDTYGNADADSKMGTKYEQIRTANDVTEDALLYSYQEKAKKEGNKALADEISKERSKPRNFVRNNYHFGEKYGLDSLSMVYIRRERKKLLEKYGPKESAGSK